MNIFSFRRTVAAYAGCGKYDYIFIDTPGGIGEPLAFASAVADTAYIVTSPTRASVRAADKTAAFLYDRGVRQLRLIINQVTGKRAADEKLRLISIIDGAAAHLKDGGELLMELGIGEAEDVKAYADGKLDFSEFIKDYDGIDRIVVFKKR